MNEQESSENDYTKTIYCDICWEVLSRQHYVLYEKL